MTIKTMGSIIHNFLWLRFVGIDGAFPEAGTISLLSDVFSSWESFFFSGPGEA